LLLGDVAMLMLSMSGAYTRPGDLDPKCRAVFLHARAAGQHLGLHPALEVIEFLQDRLLARTYMVDWHVWGISYWHMITCTVAIDRKRRADNREEVATL
jgi:hypothetical protein